MTVTGRYHSETDIRKRLGDEQFFRVFDKDRDGTADVDVLTTAIAATEATVDVKLKASHNTPFPGPIETIPQAIKDICVCLSPYEATRFTPHSDAYRKLWEDGMVLLTSLAKDKDARLPAGPPEPLAHAEAWVAAPTPLFAAAASSAESDPSQSTINGSGGGYSGF